ncbi:MAG: hypothetical protein WBH47_09965 [Streptosporangiaceae bacterium]
MVIGAAIGLTIWVLISEVIRGARFLGRKSRTRRTRHTALRAQAELAAVRAAKRADDVQARHITHFSASGRVHNGPVYECLECRP